MRRGRCGDCQRRRSRFSEGQLLGLHGMRVMARLVTMFMAMCHLLSLLLSLYIAIGIFVPHSLMVRLKGRLVCCFPLGGTRGLVALLFVLAKRLIAQKFRNPLLFLLFCFRTGQALCGESQFGCCI